MLRQLLIAALAMVLASCGETADSEQQPRPEDPPATNQQMTQELEDLGLEAKDKLPPAPLCPFWPELRVAYRQGTTCDDLRAQIRGSVSRCVPSGACNWKARLREYNVMGPGICHAYCLSNGCHGFRFTPASSCEDKPCTPDHPHCPEHCKSKDRCSPFINTTTPNCECAPLPLPPEPSPSARLQPVDDRRIG